MIYYSNVQAFVVDINSDTPKPTDRFFVDSNIWYWQAYNKASSSPNPPQRYQLYDYPKFLADAKQNGAVLYNSSLSLNELTHVIERTEFAFFDARYPNSGITGKEFRHNDTTSRRIVVQEIKTAWHTVIGMSQNIDVTLDANCSQKIIGNLSTMQIDGYDFSMLEAMEQHGIDQIITDDGDYITVPNITIFTANKTIITTARRNRKLVSRP